MLIGSKIKEIRKHRAMTMLELSEKSGVQLATISRIENNKMTGTLNCHIKLANALGVDITQIYSEIITKEGNIEKIRLEDNPEIIIKNDGFISQLLTNKISTKKMMPILITLDKNCKTDIMQEPLGSEKFIYIIKGTIDAEINKKTFSIKENESLYFKSSLRHFFSNKGETESKFISISSPVSV